MKPALLESVPSVFVGAKVAPAVACRGGRVRQTLTDVCSPSALATWTAEWSQGRKAGPSASNPKDCFFVLQSGIGDKKQSQTFLVLKNSST